MFGETPIFHVKVWNHPIETTILKWMFRVPGIYIYPFPNNKNLITPPVLSGCKFPGKVLCRVMGEAAEVPGLRTWRSCKASLPEKHCQKFLRHQKKPRVFYGAQQKKQRHVFFVLFFKVSSKQKRICFKYQAKKLKMESNLKMTKGKGKNWISSSVSFLLGSSCSLSASQ